MDIRFLTTFLEVAQTRHFGKAADNLYLTQSAVSARIKLLEEYFNTSLFIRNRNSIRLSVAGEKLVPFAQILASTLSDARKALNEDNFKSITCASTPNAFSLGVGELLSEIQGRFSEWSLRTELATIGQLSRQLHERSIDLAFTTELLKSDDIESLKLTQIPLAFFSKEPQRKELDPQQYVHIDWSAKISDALITNVPAVKSARLKTSSHHVALQYLQKEASIALLPIDSVDESWHLMPIEPHYTLTVYASYIKGTSHQGLIELIEHLKTVELWGSQKRDQAPSPKSTR